MNKKLTFLASAVLLTAPLLAFAVDPNEWINGILTRFLDIVVWPIFGGVIVIMIIYAGFKFLTARGDPGKIKEARNAVIWAIVGIAVGIAAFSAYNIIKSIIAEPPSQQQSNGDGGGGGECQPACDSDQSCISGQCE